MATVTPVAATPTVRRQRQGATKDDMGLAALLCTRLCHDVIGPAGATVNGIELMSDDSATVDEEVISSVRQSASETTRCLKFSQLPLGVAVDGQSLRDALTLAQDYLELDRVDLEWPDTALDPPRREFSMADAARSAIFSARATARSCSTLSIRSS